MKSIASSEFRKTYPQLKESTTVTVNGHAIGTWTPVSAYAQSLPAPEKFIDLGPTATPRDVEKAYSEFRPVPKTRTK